MTPDEYRQKRGNWIIASIETYVSWPTENSIYTFRDKELLLTPRTNSLYASVGMLLISGNPDEFRTGQKFIMHFLSSLVWNEDSAIFLKHWHGCGSFMPMGSGKLTEPEEIENPITWKVKRLYPRELPDPTDANTRLAMALYREALSLDHIAYRFLSLYKIINLFVGSDGKKQIQWINNNLCGLQNYESKKRHSGLIKTHQNIGEYLYGSCRCAVAHAGKQPTVDPESPEDLERLHYDTPIIHELARIVIEKEYGVKSSQTLWKEHLYELRGFKEIMGEETVIRLVNDEIQTASELPSLPKLSIRLAHNHKFMTNKRFSVFEKLIPEIEKIEDGIVCLKCRKSDLSYVYLVLDFPNEKLHFDPVNGFSLYDDCSCKAIEFALAYYDFMRIYYANGELEIWNHDQQKLLGYRDPYLPVNIDSHSTFEFFDRQIELLEKELRRRNSQIQAD